MKMNITSIVSDHKCCGCELCKEICPKNAILLREGNDGFYYPTINFEVCINCGLCLENCIVNNKVKKEVFPQKVYYGWNKQNNQTKNSTSGGIAAAFYEYAINHGGIAYGVGYCNDFYSTEYIRVSDEKKLSQIRGTKYSQAKKGSIFSNVKEDLENNKFVIFIGTPCEIAGLKRYLNKSYDNFLTVQIICLGVTSSLTIKKYIKELETKKRSKAMSVIERSTLDSWLSPLFDVKFENGLRFTRPFDSTIYAYLFSHYSRPSCYECNYKGEDRVADLTIGDAWGLDPTKRNNLGTSIIVTHSNKGDSFLHTISSISLHEYEGYNLEKFNSSIFFSRKKRSAQDIIQNNISKSSTIKLFWKSSKLSEKIKWGVAKLIPTKYWTSFTKIKNIINEHKIGG